LYGSFLHRIIDPAPGVIELEDGPRLIAVEG
jgi:hypothetical protein